MATTNNPGKQTSRKTASSEQGDTLIGRKPLLRLQPVLGCERDAQWVVAGRRGIASHAEPDAELDQRIVL